MPKIAKMDKFYDIFQLLLDCNKTGLSVNILIWLEFFAFAKLFLYAKLFYHHIFFGISIFHFE